jgi:outer membrane protein OmpA-like peptidoglycan-associated protein
MKKVLIIGSLCLASFLSWAQPRFVKERTDYNGEEVMLPFAFKIQNEKGAALPGECRLSGRLDTGELEIVNLDHQNLVAYPYRELKGAILSSGYLPDYFALFPMDLKKPEYVGKMIPITEGATFQAKGIVFLGDNTNVYFTSVDGLQSLLAFMNLHPTVRIRVIGHVNATAESKFNDTQLASLAKQRAEGIMEYLVLHGVSKHRISVMGRGREGVKYPNPQSEEELEYNRRVEIVITGL